MDRRSWTLVFAVGAIWGASFLFIEIGIRDMSPAVVAWARVALGAAFLVPFAWYRGVLRVPGAGVGLIVFLAATQVAVPFVLIGEGQKEITSSLSGILVASTPLWTALLAIRLDPSERSEGIQLWGVLAGLAGVGLLLGVDLRGTSAELVGGALVLLASLGYAIGGLVTRLKLPGAPGAGVAAWITLTATVLLTPFAVADLPAEAPGIGPAAAVVALGVVGTGVAFAMFFELMTNIGPARTFIVTYLSPGFAVIYGAALLSEPIGVATIVGLALIVGGSYLAAQGSPRPRGGDTAPR
jgi:drug/metabolite transporter (DMT)-like permease